VKVALATCSAVAPDRGDDVLLAALLRERGAEAEVVVWDVADVHWRDFDRVVIRSTWDYPRKYAAFLAWVDAIGSRLLNAPALVRWNSDKRYLADLAAAGIPVVPTQFVGPDDPLPPLAGDLVVKPTISAGARDTGRFGPATHDRARELVARIQERRRVAIVQPYLPSVDVVGEFALVFIAGNLSHTLRKRGVLRPDEIAPTRDDALGAAEAMYDASLVVLDEASAAARDLGAAAVTYLRERFGVLPAYARVDVVADDRGGSLVLELEAIEPNLYLGLSPGAAADFADAIVQPSGGTLPADYDRNA
jgi:hypothetical protein